MSTDAATLEIPYPDHVTSPAEFMGALRDLRAWADLTYRELESKASAAGDRLPRGTIASAMSRGVMPREQTVAAFVRACGGDDATVEVWLAARRRISAADQAVSDLASAVESWIISHMQGRSRKGRKERKSRKGGNVRPDLATMVEAWLLTRGRFRPDKRLGAVYGRAPVAWNRDTVAFYALDLESLGHDTEYGQGRLAQAAAQTSSSKWVGLHRRPSSRSRARAARQARTSETAVGPAYA
jgi:hypothetical protein